MTSHIRLATSADLPEVGTIVSAAYTPWIEKIGQRPGPLTDDYAALIAEGRVHVLDEGAEVLGFVVLVPQGAAMLLDNVAVAPQTQGRGIGRLLMQFAEDQARAAGLTTMRLYTHVRMDTNIALYTRLGYGETRRVTEKGLHRVYMEKPL
ncbi:GNAT family N-acetyltransferase [Pseudooceanicola sp. CBS1P-1]|uniref:GNAT family N-acetyltransferase n=1 Tax=Pseudooceanicola albus TaxID=2692189 RepID=A0A6L7FZV3_9RHOB|nr:MULTISPECIES: GNAT family N-acetyltransferase [Pseudooceanicola]MBT9385722.1 GNAT family N-acetyltransferase [Pseudooceanicola endophyticus]MXN16756.1 GNAT family N-acetyltransferase [Pseudooceanicola albus]